MKSCRYLAIALVALMIIWHLERSVSHAEPATAVDSNNRLVEAAQRTFDLTRSAYDYGRLELDNVYRWSRRLMEAELQSDDHRSSAISDHVERMRRLHEDVAAKYASGAAGGAAVNYHATIYYLEEAKSSLDRN